MARPKNPVPSYRRHHKKDRGVVEVYVAPGQRTSMLLPGPYNSPQSKAEFARIIGVVAANNGFYPVKTAARQGGGISIDELALQFMDKKAAVDYVGADGKPATERGCFRLALRVLCRFFGPVSVDSFDSADLIIVRVAMISGSSELSVFLSSRGPYVFLFSVLVGSGGGSMFRRMQRSSAAS